MQVERVQRWVMSALAATTALIFAGGLAALAGSARRAGAGPGLLVISAVVGVVAMAAIRLINEKPLLTPWLLPGLLPALVGFWFLHLR